MGSRNTRNVISTNTTRLNKNIVGELKQLSHGLSQNINLSPRRSSFCICVISLPCKYIDANVVWRWPVQPSSLVLVLISCMCRLVARENPSEVLHLGKFPEKAGSMQLQTKYLSKKYYSCNCSNVSFYQYPNWK